MTDHHRLWQETLEELGLQMTRATFETWLAGSTVVDLTGGVLHVRVRHSYAVDWLETRLKHVVLSTAARHIPGVADVRFSARPRPEPDEPPPAAGADAERDEQVEVEVVVDPALAAFDTELAGWSKLANYAVNYWSELLGAAAFVTWLAIKVQDIRRKKTAWTPPQCFSVSHLAHLAAGGNPQLITGVWRTCRSQAMRGDDRPCARCQARGGERVAPHTCRYRRPGAFEILQAEGVAAVQRRGAGFHVTYHVRVFNVLPLLTPAQEARLNPQAQERHERWIRAQALDAEAWARLTVARLVLPRFE